MTLKPFDTTQYTTRCKCGAWLPRGSTGVYDSMTNTWKHCAACRPRNSSDKPLTAPHMVI